MNTPAPLKILHLEDSSIDADIVEAHLKRMSVPCSITRATQRETFEAALEDGSFDLILSDSKLPGYDTFEALALAREKQPGTPFIFLSGNTSPRLKAEALAKGAADFISKDDLPGLIPAIQRVCGRKNSSTEEDE